MRFREFLGVWLQLTLVLAVFALFRLEELHGLARVLPIIWLGFAVHAWMPRRAQLPTFVGLSWLALLLVLGWETGSQAIAIGLGLIALCHLPVSRPLRLAALVLAASGLAAARVYANVPWTSRLFPILGAMFMFRTVVYLYDTAHEKTPSTLWERLAYFFLLPNSCFPIFPIVDYATFRRTRFDAPPLAIYQKGVRWMLRGATHLLLYRVIYQHWTPSPEGVQDLAGLLQMMVTSYCQILRISGQFHFVVGTLCLFGFDLPRTQHLYFLASSFTDYWRRANIYWRDFMVKIFLYPAYFRLRRWGVAQPMFVATLWVFAASWVLHSWQWFWLLGSFPIKAADIVFWGLFGLAVAANALWESRHRRRATPGPPSLARSLRHALQVVGVFAFVCVLWSFWTTESLDVWLSLMAQGRHTGDGQLTAALLGLAAVLGALVLGHQWAAREHRWPWLERPAVPGLLTAGLAGLLAALGTPPVQARLPAAAGQFLADSAEPGLNRADRDRFVAGYYAELQASHRLGSPLWGWERIRDQDVVVPGSMLRYDVDEPIRWRIKPDFQLDQEGVRISTNRWGMRDRDYSLEKPPGCYRIALLGASPEMGSGVRDHEVFEAQLEERLNREYAGGHFERYEILNFAVTGHRPLDYLYMLETTALRFSPDAVLYVAHENEGRRLLNGIVEWVEGGSVPSGRLGAALAEAGASRGLSRDELQRRLQPHEEALLRAFYRDIVDAARSHGARPVWAFVRLPHHARRKGLSYTWRMAQAAGFIPLLADDLFRKEEIPSMTLSRGDNHPNADAHARIAEALLARMRQHDAELGAGLDGP